MSYSDRDWESRDFMNEGTVSRRKFKLLYYLGYVSVVFTLEKISRDKC